MNPTPYTLNPALTGVWTWADKRRFEGVFKADRPLEGVYHEFDQVCTSYFQGLRFRVQSAGFRVQVAGWDGPFEEVRDRGYHEFEEVVFSF